VGRVLGLCRITQDRPRESIGRVQVLLGEAREGSSLIDLFGYQRPPVCHVHDLERLAHDDMTNGRRETFMGTGFILGA
jgi:hypothetical protein